MLPVKLMYYPNVEAYATETRFGAREVNPPGIYNKPIKDKVIVRVDLLECLREKLGDNCFINRELLYAIVSGSERSFDPQKSLAAMYRRCRSMAMYINEVYSYSYADGDFTESIVKPLRADIAEYMAKVRGIMTDAKFRPLLIEDDYYYFAAPTGTEIPTIKGASVIC